MKKSFKSLAASMALMTVAAAALAGCGGNGGSKSLVIGYDKFQGKFNPFVANNQYDVDVSDITSVGLVSIDRAAGVIMDGKNGKTIKFNDKDYKYKTTADISIDTTSTVGQTIYTFELADNIKFTDGVKMTADDVLFSIYTLCDPAYDSSSTLYTVPIIGMNEFRYDDANSKVKLAEIAAQANVYEPTETEINSMAAKLAADNEMDVKLFQKGGTYYESYTLATIKSDKKKTLEKAYMTANFADGMQVTSISGVKKISDYKVSIATEGVDPTTLLKLGFSIAPKHYYGDSTQFGIAKNSFQTSKAKTLVTKPLGAGPYVFQTYEKGVVTFKANANYFKGKPKVETLKFREISQANKLSEVELRNCDISDPPASPEMVKDVKDKNLSQILVENNGYGYVGIDAKKITDINVRKAMMAVMAPERSVAINTYYGELASVIEVPMSKVSWAYNHDAKTAEERYGVPKGADDAATAINAKARASALLTEAGYTKNGSGKLIKMIDGKETQLELIVGIPAGDSKDHPTLPVVTKLKTVFDELGAKVTLETGDKTFWDDMDSGKFDVWAAAWAATPDPDMTQIYHSSNQSGSNYYHLENTVLDEKMKQAVSILDQEQRQVLYYECLDLVMDAAVELPVYQRKNMYIYNPDVIKTMPEDLTPNYNYLKEIELIELK